MEIRITSHLDRKIRAGSSAVSKQFYPQALSEPIFSSSDPLEEEALYSPIKGLVHKYPNRVLWKVTYRCAAHCQMCTRIRQIGTPEGDLSDSDIEAGIEYLRVHPEVDDVILSGGDPLYATASSLKIIAGLATVSSVKVVRIGTRLPVHAPRSMASQQVQNVFRTLKDNASHFISYILVHTNHPDELDNEVLGSLVALRKSGFPVLSQSVFLRDVNDDPDTLERLFKRLYYAGITSYYIYRCDYVKGLEHYVCDLEREREIMTILQARMSGVALPMYVADVAGGVGKIPVPLGFWEVQDPMHCKDYNGKDVRL